MAKAVQPHMQLDVGSSQPETPPHRVEVARTSRCQQPQQWWCVCQQLRTQRDVKTKPRSQMVAEGVLAAGCARGQHAAQRGFHHPVTA